MQMKYTSMRILGFGGRIDENPVFDDFTLFVLNVFHTIKNSVFQFKYWVWSINVLFVRVFDENPGFERTNSTFIHLNSRKLVFQQKYWVIDTSTIKTQVFVEILGFKAKQGISTQILSSLDFCAICAFKTRVFDENLGFDNFLCNWAACPVDI